MWLQRSRRSVGSAVFSSRSSIGGVLFGFATAPTRVSKRRRGGELHNGAAKGLALLLGVVALILLASLGLIATLFSVPAVASISDGNATMTDCTESPRGDLFTTVTWVVGTPAGDAIAVDRRLFGSGEPWQVITTTLGNQELGYSFDVHPATLYEYRIREVDTNGVTVGDTIFAQGWTGYAPGACAAPELVHVSVGDNGPLPVSGPGGQTLFTETNVYCADGELCNQPGGDEGPQQVSLSEDDRNEFKSWRQSTVFGMGFGGFLLSGLVVFALSRMRRR
jgi:hypothetical protein